MAIIFVPRPSRKAMNPERPVSALLLNQIQHLQHAERRLPLKYRSEIYTSAIRTEREAAEYVREVTEAIHKAHADAEKWRAKIARRAGRVREIAAAAEKPKRKHSTNKKKSKPKRK